MVLTIKKIRIYSSLVMFKHTIFALPFAYLALFLAAGGWPGFQDFFWITVAMIGARNGANAWNRLADMQIDSKNPRTAERELPGGKVSITEVLGLTLLCFLLLLIAAFHLDPLALRLLPLAVFFVCFYSYTKRFTWACHFFLGAAVALAPLGTWIAVTGTISIGVILLALIHGLWVAGFDIIYATQDYEFDTRNNIFSIPARFGIKEALSISKWIHLLTVMLMFSLLFIFPLSWIYFLGVVIISLLLTIEHQLVDVGDLSKVQIASYSINQLISPLLLITAVIDLLF
ncbi:MAG: UbiA-like polyprenyltransferase [Halanaerobiales bacterium]